MANAKHMGLHLTMSFRKITKLPDTTRKRSPRPDMLWPGTPPCVHSCATKGSGPCFQLTARSTYGTPRAGSAPCRSPWSRTRPSWCCPPGHPSSFFSRRRPPGPSDHRRPRRCRRRRRGSSSAPVCAPCGRRGTADTAHGGGGAPSFVALRVSGRINVTKKKTERASCCECLRKFVLGADDVCWLSVAGV